MLGRLFRDMEKTTPPMGGVVWLLGRTTARKTPAGKRRGRRGVYRAMGAYVPGCCLCVPVTSTSTRRLGARQAMSACCVFA